MLLQGFLQLTETDSVFVPFPGELHLTSDSGENYGRIFISSLLLNLLLLVLV